MTTNAGTLDRAVRIVAGLALLAWGLGYLPGFEAPSWGMIAAAVGAVFTLTGLIGNCPAYSILGINTCGRKA